MYNNSQVIVSQVNNEYVVHSDNLKEYSEKVIQLVAQFHNFVLEKIDRSKNEVADKLTKIASGETPNDLKIEIELYSSTTHIQPLHPIMSDAPTWVDEIINYISQDILPDDKERARQIRKRVVQYIVLNNVLYRRSFIKSLLRCVPPSLTQSILEELHEGFVADTPVLDPY